MSTSAVCGICGFAIVADTNSRRWSISHCAERYLVLGLVGVDHGSLPNWVHGRVADGSALRPIDVRAEPSRLRFIRCLARGVVAGNIGRLRRRAQEVARTRPHIETAMLLCRLPETVEERF